MCSVFVARDIDKRTQQKTLPERAGCCVAGLSGQMIRGYARSGPQMLP